MYRGRGACEAYVARRQEDGQLCVLPLHASAQHLRVVRTYKHLSSRLCANRSHQEEAAFRARAGGAATHELHTVLRLQLCTSLVCAQDYFATPLCGIPTLASFAGALGDGADALSSCHVGQHWWPCRVVIVKRRCVCLLLWTRLASVVFLPL